MCGRVIQASPPDQLGLKIIDALDPRDNRVTGDPFGNVPPRYNGAPSQQLGVIRQNPQTGERSLDLLQWGLIPYWCKDKPKPPPINAKAETVDRLPMFREAYGEGYEIRRVGSPAPRAGRPGWIERTCDGPRAQSPWCADASGWSLDRKLSAEAEGPVAEPRSCGASERGPAVVG
jgi:hypothetical protein